MVPKSCAFKGLLDPKKKEKEKEKKRDARSGFLSHFWKLQKSQYILHYFAKFNLVYIKRVLWNLWIGSSDTTKHDMTTLL